MPALQTVSRFNFSHYGKPVLPLILPQPGKLEKAAVIFMLLLFSEALIGRLFTTPDNPEGNILLRLMWLPIYGYTLLMLALHWRQTSAVLIRTPFLILLGVMAMMSALWSIDPDTSLRRGFAVLCTTAFGVYLAVRFNWKEMLRCLGIAWFILGVGNFLTGALVPSFGIMDAIHVGAWKGMWIEKNTLGGHSSRAVFLFGFLVIMDKDWRRFWVGAMLLNMVLVLLSTSKTSLLGMLLGIGVLLAWLWMRENRIVALASIWIAFASIVGFVLLLLAAPEAVAEFIGRDLTLTGRTDIWVVLLRIIDESPLVGYGYGTFWALDSPPAMQVRAETEWDVPTAHNGVLEIMLSLGYLGAALFILDWLISFFRALLTVHRRAGSVFCLGFLLIVVLFNVSESIFLVQNNILWVMYCAFAARLALDMRVLKYEAKHKAIEGLMPRINPGAKPVSSPVGV